MIFYYVFDANIYSLHISNDTCANINTLTDIHDACKNIIAIIISSSQRAVDRPGYSLISLCANSIGDKWREDF